jgi:hypothetical protein
MKRKFPVHLSGTKHWSPSLQARGILDKIMNRKIPVHLSGTKHWSPSIQARNLYKEGKGKACSCAWRCMMVWE